jgi:hypothetical protein
MAHPTNKTKVTTLFARRTEAPHFPELNGRADYSALREKKLIFVEYEISSREPSAGATLMPEATPIRPSAWCYWLVVPIFLGGIGLFIYEISHGLMHVADSLTRVVVPGQASLNLERGKSYTVFYESHTTVDGKFYSTHQSVSALECHVKSLNDGEETAISPTSNPTQYKIGGRSGHSILEFSAPRDGQYDFSCAYASGMHGTNVVLAVGTGLGARMFRAVLVCFAGPLLGGLLAMMVFFWIYIRRDNAKASAAAAALLPR